MIEASLYEKLANEYVRCHLCAHRCLIPEGESGFCKVRKNEAGVLYTLVYGRAISQYSDVVEKQCLYHFYPGSAVYSIATAGCNFRCWWCQSWEIAQMPDKRILEDGRETSPEQAVSAAVQAGCQSIAFTFTEPTIFFEYAFDIALLAKASGLTNILVTNGYMTTEMLEVLWPYLDAVSLELKAFRNEAYQRYCEADLQPVLDSFVVMKRMGIWIEVSMVIIPGMNDSPAELRDAAQFIAQELGPDTPWHLARFYPAFKMADRRPTTDEALLQAKVIGQEAGLHYVYLSGVPGEADLHCYQCGQVLIRRCGLRVLGNDIRDGCCPICHTPIAGLWPRRPPCAALKSVTAPLS